MSQENVEIVRRIYEGWASGDFRVGADLLDDHVMFVVSHDFPEFGEFTGGTGVESYMRRFLRELGPIRSRGDTDPSRWGPVSCPRSPTRDGQRKRSPRRRLDLHALHVSGTKIVRIESLRNEAEALEAVGLSEQDAHADSA